MKTLSLLRTTSNEQLITIKIVYTPLHGSGVKLVPLALKSFGFENVYEVKEQSVPDGNFPTLKSPNPEVPSALELGIRDAKKINADLVLATDPDADRVGIAVKVLINSPTPTQLPTIFCSMATRLPLCLFIICLLNGKKTESLLEKNLL